MMFYTKWANVRFLQILFCEWNTGKCHITDITTTKYYMVIQYLIISLYMSTICVTAGHYGPVCVNILSKIVCYEA